MSRVRTSLRTALAASLLAVLLASAGAAAGGFFLELHAQRTDRAQRLSSAARFVQRGLPRVTSRRWQRSLTRELSALRLQAALTHATRAGRRPVYESAPLAATAKRRSFPVNAQGKFQAPSPGRPPSATYGFALPSAETLLLELYAPPLDRTRQLLMAVASGAGALLAGLALLIWAASRWEVTPLRRLSEQVDAIAGGDKTGDRVRSRIREIDNVATAVSGMAATLTRTAEQDAQLDAERRFLVGSVAHDLRTPLFSLRSHLDAITDGIGRADEHIDSARAKATQIDKLITSLFRYARAELDERPRLETVELVIIVRAAAASFELAACEAAVTLRIDCAPVWVTIDRDRFERALANILDNALRYTPRGGAIDLECGSDLRGAYVRVVDDGPGIDADLLPHVLEPLVRGDRSRNSRTGGAGLGLAIAARLLESQGGTIEAANTPHRGAVVTLRVPQLADAEPVDAADGRRRRRGGRPATGSPDDAGDSPEAPDAPPPPPAAPIPPQAQRR